jgi:hypothetical protein
MRTGQWITIIVVVLILIGAGVGIYFLVKHIQKNKKPDNINNTSGDANNQTNQ